MAAIADSITAAFPHSSLQFQVAMDPRSVETEWRKFGSHAIGHVFADYDFIAPWTATVGAERQIAPRIVLVRDRAGRLQALLPFGIRRAFGARLLEWLGGEQADYPGGFLDRDLLAGLADEAEARRFVTSVLDAAGGDAVRLERQPGTLHGFANPFAIGGRRHPDDAHQTRLGHDWEAYYTAKRQTSSRRVDSRKRRKLEKDGAVRLLVAESPPEAEPILAALFEQKRRGLAELGVPDPFAAAATRDFFRSLAAHAYPKGPSHIAALLCGDAIVASNWGLVRGRRYYYVMHGFAGGLVSRASPGRHLMYELMRWCIERDIEIFDFTIGNEPYKGKWCETSSPLFTTILSRNARGTALATALRSAAALKRVVKTTPALWRAAELTRRRLGRRGSEDEGE